MIMGTTTLRGLALLLLALLLGACTNPSGSEKKPVEETWSYTVSFDKNGGDTEAVPATKTVANPATSVDTLPEPPTRTGHEFAGWNTKADGAGAAFDGTSTVSADLTVYAQWTETLPGPSYTVVFKLNDGTKTDHASKIVEPPASAIAAENFPANPTRTGYEFAGWNTQADGTGAAFDTTSTVNSDITVYAQWRKPSVFLAITLQPAPGDPSLSSVELFEDETANFSVATGYESYQWHWDGQAISGAVAADYTLADSLKTSGIHELSVSVTTGDAMLSARCRVAIKAR
jgi:uncharacterized repeat protein (TIGR02543 family)